MLVGQRRRRRLTHAAAAVLKLFLNERKRSTSLAGLPLVSERRPIGGIADENPGPPSHGASASPHRRAAGIYRLLIRLQEKKLIAAPRRPSVDIVTALQHWLVPRSEVTAACSSTLGPGPRAALHVFLDSSVSLPPGRYQPFAPILLHLP